jgi:hypothetical protein
MTVLTPPQGVDLVAQLAAIRGRLDRSTELLNRALDLHQQLAWGVLDLYDARDMVAQLKRDVAKHKRRSAV